MSARGKGRESDARYRNLCRRLVSACWGSRNGGVEVLGQAADIRAAPRSQEALKAGVGAPAAHRRPRPRRQHALADHDRLSPAGAGLRLGACRGAGRVRDLRATIPDAGKILLHNVYGWFDRAERASTC